MTMTKKESREFVRLQKQWMESQSFLSSADITTLGAPNSENRQYLENRLLQAFRDGFNRGMECQRAIIEERLVKLIMEET